MLRNAGAPLTLITARALIVASILGKRPEILEYTFHDGSRFKVSESFVRNLLRCEMQWSMRKSTRAAQKLPKDWKEQCERSFLRKAYIIKEEDIPAPLYLNSDQTQAGYAPGNRMTWAPTGSKQVSLVGVDDKRAFTLLVTVAANGTLLPFQAVYMGGTKLSCPSEDAPHALDAAKAGFRFEFSGTKTYWSNLQTMQDFVTYILKPYIKGVRAELQLPDSQKAIWQIDVWSVHRSQAFRDWMKENHPDIILDYVPGGCTGIHQPCDVGIQRPLKLSIRRSYHEDIVEEFRSQLRKDGEVKSLDERIAILRNRSVRWIWNAFCAVNIPDLVKKVIFTYRFSPIILLILACRHSKNVLLSCPLTERGIFPMSALQAGQRDRHFVT